MIASTVDSVYDVQCMCGYGIASSIFECASGRTV